MFFGRRPKAAAPGVHSEYYEFLGIEYGCDQETIRKAYKRLAAQWHPDRNPEQEENFKKLQKVYEVLNNEEKREIYDKYGEEGLENPYINDNNKKEKRGRDLTKKIGVELDDLFKGVRKKIRIIKRVICVECNGLGAKDRTQIASCRTCNGSGHRVQILQQGILIQQVDVECNQCGGSGSIIKNPCTKCNGERTIVGEKEVEIIIDPGMSHGQKIVLHQEADQEPGVIPGNIVFIIHQLPHNTFERRGIDLFMKQKISLKEALCGINLYIKHLDGRVLFIKTKPGEIILPGPTKCVQGEGMPTHKKIFHKGRLYVDFEIEFPASLSKEQIDALAKILPGPELAIRTSADKSELEDVDLIDALPPSEKEEPDKLHEAYESDDEEGQRVHVPNCGTQ